MITRHKAMPVIIFLAAIILSACAASESATGDSSANDFQPLATAAAILAESPEATKAVLPATVFPAAGAMLDVSCDCFFIDKPENNLITVEYLDLKSWESSAKSFDLSWREMETAEPRLVLRREFPLSAVLFFESTPVEDKADRQWILDQLAQADFKEADASFTGALHCMLLLATEGGSVTEYHIYADGSLAQTLPDGRFVVAHGATDYLRFSSLAYKYTTNTAEILGASAGCFWLAEFPLLNYEKPPEAYSSWWESEDYPLPPAAHYRLCVQGPNCHFDLDRAQARVFLTTLFGTNAYGATDAAVFASLAVPEPSWMPGEDYIQLTEYLYTAGTYLEPSTPDAEMIYSQSFLLCSDGRFVQLSMRPASYRHEFGIEYITPSRQRFAVAENAFDPAMLQACLAGLSG